MSTKIPKPDAWETLQGEMEKVSALRGEHPELFTATNVSFSFFPSVELPNIGIHGERAPKYAFAKKHQEVGWQENSHGNWNGVYGGLNICLFSMRDTSAAPQKVVFPKTNEEADDAAGFPKTPIATTAATASMTPEQRAVDFCKDPSIEKAAEIMYGDKGLHPDLAKAMEVVNRAPGTNPNPNPTFI